MRDPGLRGDPPDAAAVVAAVTYTAAAVTGVCAAVVLDVAVLRTKLVLGRVFWCSYPIVLAFQLLSNGILTGRGVVLYNPSSILGVRVVHAPVEDLAFGFALVLATLAVWASLRPPAASRPGPSAASPPGPPGVSRPGPSAVSRPGPPAASRPKPSAASRPGPGPSEPPEPRP
ncbi:lycopene cyclase domain-containing protein [Dactylosporangium sp. CA-233914]|uniref:lycopene cyclase domain-containing protein n=1 Tax=Dactylosporangium sp. CA-233914 TaxID=3239934 RepID=UPI003D92CEF4